MGHSSQPMSGTSRSIHEANRLFTISNLLSMSRALLAIPFMIVMAGMTPPSRFWAAVIIVLAAITDKLDGVFARKYNQITEWGKILDPLADKIAVASVVISLLFIGEIPVWFVAVVLGRDVLIFLGGAYVKAKKNIILPSNETGKWAVGIVALTLFMCVLGIRSVVVDILVAASVVMMGLSLFFYLKRFIRVMSTSNTL